MPNLRLLTRQSFSLNLGGEPGTVSHVGIRYADTQVVTSALLRTKAEGMTVREQPDTTCCYAKADKFWVRDTDGLEWEMYTLLEDTEVHSIVETPKDVCCSPTPTAQIVTESQVASSCCAPVETPLVQIQAKRACC